MIRSSVSATSTWTPPVVPESMIPRQPPSSANTQPRHDEHVAACHAQVVPSPTSSPEVFTTPHAPEPNSSDEENGATDVEASLDSGDGGSCGERSALILDNMSIVQW